MTSEPGPALFQYPAQAAFGKVLPKSKVFTFGKVSRRIRDIFAVEIDKIIWQYKLAPETLNLPATKEVPEIQIFQIDLKPGVEEITEDLLRCIDNAVNFPIIYELTSNRSSGAWYKAIAAYKRPNEADASKWVVDGYFGTNWLPADMQRLPLPVTLSLSGLYEALIKHLLPLECQPEETARELAERCSLRNAKQRELDRLEKLLLREKQFNRKIEINAQIRQTQAEVDELTIGKVNSRHHEQVKNAQPKSD